VNRLQKGEGGGGIADGSCRSGKSTRTHQLIFRLRRSFEESPEEKGGHNGKNRGFPPSPLADTEECETGGASSLPNGREKGRGKGAKSFMDPLSLARSRPVLAKGVIYTSAVRRRKGSRHGKSGREGREGRESLGKIKLTQPLQRRLKAKPRASFALERFEEETCFLALSDGKGKKKEERGPQFLGAEKKQLNRGLHLFPLAKKSRIAAIDPGKKKG